MGRISGGSVLAGSLLKAKLIDELVLKVNPVMIGEGTLLFSGLKPYFKMMDLSNIKYYNNGVIKPSYRILYS
ncbi:dihydrofolate reductase family protein [Fictibacillus barbaricus]|nr:dihydrofolate reductase family protein [Fictibacillus barbaricus]